MSVRDKQNANLMGPRWVKGQSGNPGGRKKGVERRYREVVEANEYVARNGQIYKGIDALVMVLWDIATNPDELGSYRRAAVDSIVDRGWGKVKDTVVVENAETPTVDWRSVPTKDREEILGAIYKLQEIAGAGEPESPTEH